MKREPTDDATESKTLRRDRHSPRGNRETPEAPLPVGGRGRLGKVLDQRPNRHVSGESDDLIVPEKQANKVGPTPAAESVEGRGSPKGNRVSVLLTPDTVPDHVRHRRARRATGRDGLRTVLIANTQGRSRMR